MCVGGGKDLALNYPQGLICHTTQPNQWHVITEKSYSFYYNVTPSFWTGPKFRKACIGIFSSIKKRSILWQIIAHHQRVVLLAPKFSSLLVTLPVTNCPFSKIRKSCVWPSFAPTVRVLVIDLFCRSQSFEQRSLRVGSEYDIT